jgi:DNA-directed RNA polymerase
MIRALCRTGNKNGAFPLWNGFGRSYSEQIILKWNGKTKRFEEPYPDIKQLEHITRKGRLANRFKDLYLDPQEVDLVRRVRVFEACIRTGQIDRAKKLLQELSKSEDSATVVTCFSSLIANLPKLEDQIRTLTDIATVLGKSGPGPSARLFAFVLHNACNENDIDKRNEAIMSLTAKWTREYNVDMDPLFRHEDLISLTDRQLILNVGRTVINATDFKNKQTKKQLIPQQLPKETISVPQLDVSCHDLLSILATPMNMDQLFGEDKIRASINSTTGDINYLKLYDLLDQIEKARFERHYELFNQNRQEGLEGIMSLTNPAKTRLSASKSSILVWRWQTEAEAYIAGILNGSNRNDELEPYKEVLSHLGPTAVSRLLAQEMFFFVVKLQSGAEHSRHHVSQLTLHIGRSVEWAFLSKFAKEYHKKMGHDYGQQMISHGKYWLLSNMDKWTSHDKVTVGSSLLSLAIKLFQVKVVHPETGESVLRPAFWHTFEMSKLRHVGVVRTNDGLISQITSGSQDYTTAIVPRLLPMLVKPRPWTSFNNGGYLYTSQPLLSIQAQSNEQTAYLKTAISRNKMQPFLDGLDDVASCAWAVNQMMLNVITEIWQSGDGFLDIPASVNSSSLPPKKHPVSYRERFLRRREQIRLINQRSERNNYGVALEVARAYALHGDRFYFAYQIDFRGRAYPLSSSGFTHMAQDSIRSLLHFWYGKPLGKHGFRWLKIHLANMYGVDKVPNIDRELFVDAHMDDIMDSADNPMRGRQWWARGDKPFQVLATCFEVRDAIRSGDIQGFLSRIPVNQDGSCNGLQHYAALGGDTQGASQVNMAAGIDRPIDVYSKVNAIVLDKVAKDAANGNSVAKELSGKITRKVVKQPVMTSVYGVTKFGIIKQLNEHLKGIKDIGNNTPHVYGEYVASLILSAIEELFGGANEIKDWLGECVSRICESVRADFYGPDNVPKEDFMKKFLTSLIWTTPLGLPVVQPYRTSPSMIVRTQLQAINLHNPFALSFVDRAKHKQGVAPNYVHSLDSSHMLMTATQCVRRNLTFAAVHDSFWTHAASVPAMNRILREQFANLHGESLIRRLRDEFVSRYSGHMQLVYVSRFSRSYPEIERLRASYPLPLRSKGVSEIDILRHELELEYNRWRLQKKTDADKSATQQILTPAAILEKNCQTPYRRSGERYDDRVPRQARKGNLRGTGDVDQEAHQRMSKTKWTTIFVPLRIPAVPSKGDYQVSEVLGSEYFFS